MKIAKFVLPLRNGILALGLAVAAFGQGTGSVNVKTMGVKGDGVTFDSQTIQAVLDSGAKNIIFPPGEYLLDKPLRINQFGLTIRGSKGMTYLIATPPMDAIFEITYPRAAAGALSLVLADLRFHAQGEYRGWGVRTKGGNALIDSRIENCWVSLGTLSQGFFQGRATYSSFSNNVHELGKVFVDITHGGALSFINNKIYSTYDEAFRFGYGGDNDQVNDVVITGVNASDHHRGPFINARRTTNLNVSNINYSCSNSLPDNSYYTRFANLEDATATLANIRVAGQLVGSNLKLSSLISSSHCAVQVSNVHGDNVATFLDVRGRSKVMGNLLTMTGGRTFLQIQDASGYVKVADCVVDGIGFRGVHMAGTNTIDVTVDSLLARNPNLGFTAPAAPFYFHTSGKVDFLRNTILVNKKEANISYFLELDGTTEDTAYIDGCNFIGRTNTGGKISNNGSGKFRLGLNSGLYGRIYSASTPPVSGTWTLGDRILNAQPAVGQAKGWICTASGTPGTWVSEGNL
jgi:hypothetical protein